MFNFWLDVKHQVTCCISFGWATCVVVSFGEPLVLSCHLGEPPVLSCRMVSHLCYVIWVSHLCCHVIWWAICVVMSFGWATCLVVIWVIQLCCHLDQPPVMSFGSATCVMSFGSATCVMSFGSATCVMSFGSATCVMSFGSATCVAMSLNFCVLNSFLYFNIPGCVCWNRIGHDWQFDDSVSKIYGCKVLAYDPRYVPQVVSLLDEVEPGSLINEWKQKWALGASSLYWPFANTDLFSWTCI